jgi:ABC-type transport system involved in Fe-S cluster assembly fused permease/ATPase subunit
LARGERPAKAPGQPGEARLLPALRRLNQIFAGLPGQRWRIALALTITIAAKAATVASPFLLADGVNRLVQGEQAGAGPAFVILALAWGALRFGGQAAPYARDALFGPVSAEAQRLVATRVFAHVHALSVGYHQSKRTGALQRVIDRGVASIDFLVRFLFFNIAPSIFELALAAVALTVAYNALFAAIAIGTIVIYAAVTFGLADWRLKFRRQMNESDQEAAARAVDSLLNYETVKTFAAEARETQRFDQAIRARGAAAVKASSSLAALNAAQAFVTVLGLLAMVLAAGNAVAEGRMGPGDIAAVTLVMLNLYAPLNILGFAYLEIKQSAVDMEKMFELLDEPASVADSLDAKRLLVREGGVRFDDVSFAHEGRATGLTHVTFEVPGGKSLALVGPSGAGKSTVLRLLFRFYDPDGGAVLIDGQDIRTVTQASLRTAVGVVPQDVVLFNDTIRYNIAYGRPDASTAELREAAAKAQLLEFIESLPQGWDTRVGERGLKLSGGEKQRVGIARVILTDPKILVLDEATSALDSATEAEVQEALDAAAAGRTTIVVAHRLSTIARAAEILVLDAGQIVERGDHETLVAKGGLYADLWTRQAEGAGESSEPIRASAVAH